MKIVFQTMNFLSCCSHFLLNEHQALTSSNVSNLLLRHGCLFLYIVEVSQLSSRLTSESRIYADKAKDLNRQVSCCNFGAKTFYIHLKPWSLSDCILICFSLLGYKLKCFYGMLPNPWWLWGQREEGQSEQGHWMQRQLNWIEPSMKVIDDLHFVRGLKREAIRNLLGE